MQEVKHKAVALGPAPTFSSRALEEMTQDIDLDTSLPTIREVVAAVDSGSALVGVVPLRNSIVGEIRDTGKALLEFSNVRVLLTRSVPIEMSLVTHKDATLKDIKFVYSKPQALDQCREWLTRNLPDAQLVGASSTSDGMAGVLVDKTKAVIGLAELADGTQTKALARCIQDSESNTTEFAVLVNPNTFGANDGLEEG